jgi:lysophospholipase L1-like esterase
LPGFQVRIDDRLFFRMHPNLPGNGEPLTNSLGLRWPEIPPKAADEFRVLALGESTTFGWKVRAAETYSALLEQRLGTVAGRRVRVVNGGAPAYTSLQGLVFLRDEGPALAPDAVLVYFGANDLTPASFRTKRGAPWVAQEALTDRQQFERQQRPLARLGNLLLMHSNAFRAVALWGGSVPATDEVAPGSTVRVPDEDRRWVLHELVDLCRARGIRLVVVIPWYLMFEDHIPLLRAFAAEHVVPVIDLPDRLSAIAGPARKAFFMDLIHPNALGHQRIAEAIDAGLRDSWPDIAAETLREVDAGRPGPRAAPLRRGRTGAISAEQQACCRRFCARAQAETGTTARKLNDSAGAMNAKGGIRKG